MVKKISLWIVGLFFLSGISQVRAAEIFKDGFEGSKSPEWVVRSGSEGSSFEVSSEQVMNGSRALKINFPSGEIALMEKKFDVVQKNVLVRAFLYDEYETTRDFGAMLTVRENESQGGTGLGVQTNISRDYYVMRVDGPTNMRPTKVKRSRGWHMLELIITDKGTYGKIDGTLVNIEPMENRSSQAPISEFWLNPNLTGLGIVQLGQSWKMWGRSYWDEVLVVSQETGSWEEIFWKRFDSYNEIYRRTDLEQIMGPITANMSSNYARHRGDMAVYFYLYGVKHNESEAKAKGVKILSDLIRDFNDIDWWVRGGSILSMVRGTYLMKGDLDTGTLNRFKELMRQQAQKILGSDPGAGQKPLSGYGGDTKAEENAWDAAFLASMANFFPEMSEAAGWEAKARCMGFHSITRGIVGEDTYCNKTTQTVYSDYKMENHSLVSPMYANGTILLLAEAAQSYELTGKKVPSEYYHNVVPLFNNFIKPRIDFNNYYWKGVPSDWAGVWNTFEVYGLSVLDFVEKAGGSTGINRTDYMKKMSLFAYKIPGNYTKGDKAEAIIANNPNHQTYKDFAYNTVIAGEYFSTAALNLGVLKNLTVVPSPTLVPTKMPVKIAGISPSPTMTPVHSKVVEVSSPSPTIKPKVAGDASGDGVVDIRDASVWRSEFIAGELGTVERNNWMADFDGNKKVTLNDYSVWRGELVKGL